MKRKVFTVFITICTLFTIFKVNTFAATDDTWFTLSGYGTMYQSATADGLYDFNTVHIQFNDNYEGNFILRWNYDENYSSNNPNLWNWVVYGATITSFTNYNIYLHVWGSNEVTIEMSHQKTNNAETPQVSANYFAFTGISNHSLTATTNHIESIDAKLTNTNSTLDEIKNRLISLDGGLLNLEQYTDNIEQLITDTNSYINGLPDDFSDVKTLLQNQLNNTTELINLVRSKFIDSIPHESVMAYMLFRSLGGLQLYYADKYPYYNITNDIHTSYKSYLYANKAYYFSFRFYNPDNNSLWNNIHIINNSGTNQTYSRSYHDYYSNYSTVTISFTPTTSDYYRINLDGYLIGKTITPLYVGDGYAISSELANITHLPQSSADYNSKLDSIIYELQNLTIDVSNTNLNVSIDPTIAPNIALVAAHIDSLLGITANIEDLIGADSLISVNLDHLGELAVNVDRIFDVDFDADITGLNGDLVLFRQANGVESSNNAQYILDFNQSFEELDYTTDMNIVYSLGNSVDWVNEQIVATFNSLGNYRVLIMAPVSLGLIALILGVYRHKEG